MPDARPLTRYLVRHGRTQYNEQGRVQGWCDSPLTPDGLDQVRATAAALAQVPFVAAYASPSGRTVTTAREILRYHPDLELTCDDDLREMSFGQFEALAEEQMWATLDPGEVFAQMRVGGGQAIPGGETGDAYLARVTRAFDRIEAAHPDGGDVLVVSHGVTLVTHLVVRGVAPSRSLPNASVSVLRSSPDGDVAVQIGWDPSGRAVPGIELPDSMTLR